MRTLILLLLFPALTAAQTKIYYSSGLLRDRWSIDNIGTATKNEIGLHLAKHSPKALVEFKAYRRATRNARVWDVVGAIGIAGVALSRDTKANVGFASVAVVGCTGLIISGAKAKKHRKRAIQINNAIPLNLY